MRSAGRPRDPAVDAAIRTAVLQLAEAGGFQSVTMEAIAGRSGVSKQSLYRRYRNRGEAILEALSGYAVAHIPTPDTGTLAGDLEALLVRTFEALRGPTADLNRGLVAEAIHDDVFRAKLWAEHISVRREAVKTLVTRAVERGELPETDPNLVPDLVFGPMWYRLTFQHGPLDADYAAQLTRAALTGLTAGPST